MMEAWKASDGSLYYSFIDPQRDERHHGESEYEVKTGTGSSFRRQFGENPNFWAFLGKCRLSPLDCVMFQSFKHQIACITTRDEDKYHSKFTKSRHFKRIFFDRAFPAHTQPLAPTKPCMGKAALPPWKGALAPKGSKIESQFLDCLWAFF